MIEIKLKQLLKEKNVKQYELSKITGIHQSRISTLLNNSTTSINRVHMDKIAKALNVTDIRDLIDFSKEEGPLDQE